MHHWAWSPRRCDWMLKVTKHWGHAAVLNDTGQGINDSSRTHRSHSGVQHRRLFLQANSCKRPQGIELKVPHVPGWWLIWRLAVLSVSTGTQKWTVQKLGLAFPKVFTEISCQISVQIQILIPSSLATKYPMCRVKCPGADSSPLHISETHFCLKNPNFVFGSSGKGERTRDSERVRENKPEN